MKDKIITYSFLIFIFSFSIYNILLKDNNLSYEERRKLENFPSINVDSVLNGSYMKKFEKYTLDQFPFRNELRTIKAYTTKYIFNKSDNNNIFDYNNGIYKMEYPTNNKLITNFVDKINSINDTYLKKNNVYLSVIPDKNYYINNNNLKLDYEYIFKELNKINVDYIDIKDRLSIDDYYRTDTHWRQEKIINVADELLLKMGNDLPNRKYLENEYDKFYGVYYGQSALRVEPDNLIYLTNKNISESKVKHIENNKSNEIYDLNKLGEMDSYDVFLSGASSLIKIENENSLSNKELIIFRDSFGSSIAPLFIDCYKKITLIDLRYISMNSVANLINFEDKDVLFLYSTLIINNSNSLK